MPNFNGAKYLKRAIDSFIAEDYELKELIIVDGKSTDGSHEIIAEYRNKFSSIKWIKTPDEGISDAINIAIDAARGSIIGYLGSDDLLSGNTLRTIARWEPFVDFDAVFFNSYTYYVNERRCILQRPVTLQIDTESLLGHGTIVGLQNTFYRRRLFDQVRFNVENKYSMDYELLLEAASRNCMFFYIDGIATLNYFDGNISHNNDAQLLEAAHVARRFCGGYSGVLFGENLLPEEDRRPIPVPEEIISRTENGDFTYAAARGGDSSANKLKIVDETIKYTLDQQLTKASANSVHLEINQRNSIPGRLTSYLSRVFAKLAGRR